MLPTSTRKHANVHTLSLLGWQSKNESPSKPYGQKLISLRAVLQRRDGILMPENPSPIELELDPAGGTAIRI